MDVVGRRPMTLTLLFGEDKKVRKSMPGLYFWHVANELVDDLTPISKRGFSRAFLVLIAQATALEALLNDEIAIACMTQFGPEHYEVYAQPLIRASVKEKLVAVPALASRNLFLLNQASAEVSALFELLARRNKCVHATASFEDVATDENEERKRSVSMDHALTITLKDLQRYSAALRAFVEEFAFDTGILDSLFTELAPVTPAPTPATPSATPYSAAADYLSKGLLDRASAEASRVLARGGDAVEGLTLLGEVYARQGAYGEALER